MFTNHNASYSITAAVYTCVVPLRDQRYWGSLIQNQKISPWRIQSPAGLLVIWEAEFLQHGELKHLPFPRGLFQTLSASGQTGRRRRNYLTLPL